MTIPNRVTTIGQLAFANNYLESVSIPNSVTSIGEFAFAWNKLTCLTIGVGVTSIGGIGAFYRNPLVNVTIGNNVHIASESWGGVIICLIGSGFYSFYIAQGRRAGYYTFSGGQWRWAEERQVQGED